MPFWGRQVHCYECSNNCSAMHRIGGIPNNCKFLWIQANAELAGVQLLFLGSSMKQRTQGGRLRFHKIAVSSITLAELVSLVEKSRLPFWAYQELTQALADPEH